MTLPILHLLPTRDGMMLAPRYDRYVSASLDMYGEYSPEERELLCSLVQPGDVVCQVGANIGALTVPLARAVGPTGKVLALEPQAVIYRALVANLALSNLWHVEALKAAAGATRGTVSMPEVDYAKPGNFGGLSVSPEQTSQKVPMVTLDGVLADVPRLALLHLDCEGHELAVLEGAVETIRRHRPILYVEIDRPEVRDGLAAILAQHDYLGSLHTPWLFSPLNWRQQSTNIFQDDAGTPIASFNALCVPSEQAQRLSPLLSQLQPLTVAEKKSPGEGVTEEAA